MSSAKDASLPSTRDKRRRRAGDVVAWARIIGRDDDGATRATRATSTHEQQQQQRGVVGRCGSAVWFSETEDAVCAYGGRGWSHGAPEYGDECHVVSIGACDAVKRNGTSAREGDFRNALECVCFEF